MQIKMIMTSLYLISRNAKIGKNQNAKCGERSMVQLLAKAVEQFLIKLNILLQLSNSIARITQEVRI